MYLTIILFYKLSEAFMTEIKICNFHPRSGSRGEESFILPNRYSTCEVELRNIDYYSPQEFEFSQLLKENLKKKYKLVFGEEKD